MKERTKLEMLNDFMAGINTMIDASTQMTHQRMNPKFMAIRDMLHLIRDDAKNLVKDGLYD